MILIESRFLIYAFIKGGFHKWAEFTNLFVMESLLFRLTMRIVWTIIVQEIVRHLEDNHIAKIFISRCREFFLNLFYEVFIVVIHFAEMMRSLVECVGITADLDAISSHPKIAVLGFLSIWFSRILIYRICSRTDVFIVLVLKIMRLPKSHGQLLRNWLIRGPWRIIVIIHHFWVVVAQIVVRKFAAIWFNLMINWVFMRSTLSISSRLVSLGWWSNWYRRRSLVCHIHVLGLLK